MTESELAAIEARAKVPQDCGWEHCNTCAATRDIPALVAEVRRLSGERFVCTSCGEGPNDCECVQADAVPWWRPGWTGGPT